MSVEYDLYLYEHVKNTEKGFKWLQINLPDVVFGHAYVLNSIRLSHDASKRSKEEYEAYDNYFYNASEHDENTLKAFDRAWLHHIHENPHHWQHWVLINDDDGVYALDIPYEYILEMVCDWWSFSWKSGDLTEIFNWYNTRKDKIIFSEKTRETVEDILNQIKERLLTGDKNDFT